MTQSDTFHRRFRSIGDWVSHTLSIFSLDVCGIICEYAICGLPARGKSPKLLDFFKTPEWFKNFDMDIDPLNGNIWLLSRDGIYVFDERGIQIFNIPKFYPLNISFNSKGTVFVLYNRRGNMYCDIFSTDGKIIKTLNHVNISWLNGTTALASNYSGSTFFLKDYGIYEMNHEGLCIKSIPKRNTRSFGKILAYKDEQNLFVCDWDSERLDVFNLETKQQNPFIFKMINAIAVDVQGNIYCHLVLEEKLWVLNKNGEKIMEMLLDKSFSILSIKVDKHGQIYLRDLTKMLVFAFQS